jgi:magnesium transporter
MMQERAIRFDLDSREIAEIDPSHPAVEPDRPRVVYWFHFRRSPTEDPSEKLTALGIDESTVRQLSQPALIPGMIEGDADLLLNLEYWEAVFPPSPEFDPVKFTLFMTERYIVTLVDAEIPAVTEFNRTYRREFRFAQSTGFALFLILDHLVDHFVTTLGPMDLRCEQLADRIHSSFDSQLNREILDLKHKILVMKRVVTATRDILMRISGRRIPVITEACRSSLQDIYDHAHVLVSSIESLHEMTASTLDSYMSVLAQRLNETMKVLTVFSAVIMPMTLVAGIYGMNFDFMPELDWQYGYLWALFLMFGSGLLLVYFFRRRRWI